MTRMLTTRARNTITHMMIDPLAPLNLSPTNSNSILPRVFASVPTRKYKQSREEKADEEDVMGAKQHQYPTAFPVKGDKPDKREIAHQCHGPGDIRRPRHLGCTRCFVC